MDNAELAQKAREALAYRFFVQDVRRFQGPKAEELIDRPDPSQEWYGHYLRLADEYFAETWHDIDPSLPKVKVVLFQHPEQDGPTISPLGSWSMLFQDGYDLGVKEAKEQGWVRTVPEEE